MSAQNSKYKELLRRILNDLTGDYPLGDELLKPMRIYINDIERFNSPVIFTAKFHSFLESRDECLINTYLAEHDLLAPKDLLEIRSAINLILEQVLDSLQVVEQSADSEALAAAIEKIQTARTLNNARQISDQVAAAGEKILHKNREIQTKVGKLVAELSMCKHQIGSLQDKLEVTRHLAENDHLTQLSNRRMFDKDLRNTVDQAQRFQEPMSLMLLDLDHFKLINDQWGHAVGDEVLINFANLLQSSLRDFDLIYRLGGDEFAVIYSSCELERAMQVAERVRCFISQNDYQAKGLQFKLTLSGGVAQLRSDETEEVLLKRTDQLLYKAKNRGRDCIVSEKCEVD